MPNRNSPYLEHVVILAPRGRDAEVARELLDAAGISVMVVASVGCLCKSIDDGVGAVLLTEDALKNADTGPLSEKLDEQPAWSDLPFVVLTNGTHRTRSQAEMQRIDDLGNAVLLARPLHSDEILRAVRSALKARSRQYEARARIDELHESERQLRESEAKFHAIIDFVDQMVWSTLPDGYHDFYNDRWYEYTGVPKGSTDGVAWKGMFHPDDQDRASKVWNASLKTGEFYQIEYRLRHYSGAYRWVLGRAKPVRDETGKITRWYGTCTDIHEQIEAREAMEKHSEGLKQAVVERTEKVSELTRQRDRAWDLSADLMAVCDSGTGDLITINAAWTDVLAWSEEELLGRGFANFAHPDDLERAQTEFVALQRRGVSKDFEYRLTSQGWQLAVDFMDIFVERASHLHLRPGHDRTARTGGGARGSRSGAAPKPETRNNRPTDRWRGA